MRFYGRAGVDNLRPPFPHYGLIHAFSGELVVSDGKNKEQNTEKNNLSELVTAKDIESLKEFNNTEHYFNLPVTEK